MAALTANATILDYTALAGALPVEDAEVVYAGGFGGIRAGYLGAWTAADSEIPLGRIKRKITGATASDPDPESDFNLDDEVLRVTVTGATGIVDNGKPVWCATDNPNDATLTRPSSNGIVRGMVLRWISGTTCDVLFFGVPTLCAIALGGGGSDTVFLGTVNGVVSAGTHSTGWVAPYHGRILAVYGIVLEPITDADADGDINVEIGGTDVTGGVIEWVTADLLGAKKAGTAITAGNEFHQGDLVDLEMVQNTAGTAADGYMNVFATVERMFGV